VLGWRASYARRTSTRGRFDDADFGTRFARLLGAKLLVDNLIAKMARGGDRPSNVPPLRGRRTPAPAPRPRRRSFPFFSVALFSIMAAGVLMATVFRGDPAGDFRNILAWLQRLDFTSTAAQPPAARRASDVANAGQAQRPIDSDGHLKAAMEKSAAERRANLRTPDDKPEQSAVQEAARLNQTLERERETAQPPGREAAQPPGREAAQSPGREAAQSPGREAAQAAGRDAETTNTVAALNKSAADDAAAARLTRSIEVPPAQDNRPALREPENTAGTAKLIDRASGLLRLGDIGGARLVLAIASENGSARATFMLAQTYDPRVLSTWNAMGTRADAAKARELYAKAYAGGIAEAKARSEALPK
jgi:hypothetical protein